MDEETAKVITLAKRIGVTIHVRGTDERPVVELREKHSRRVVGGIELRRRLEALK